MQDSETLKTKTFNPPGNSTEKEIPLTEFPQRIQNFTEKNYSKKPHITPKAGLSGKEIYNLTDVPWLNLDIEVPYAEMFQEALPFVERMVPQNYPELFDLKFDDNANAQEGWNTICIHGISAESFDRGYMYGYQHEDEVPYGWTEIAEACPVTKQFLLSLPYEKLYRCRFTVLHPGGYSSPHIGRKQAADYSRKINIALNHPEGFHFYVEGQGDIPWKAGKAIWFAADDFYHSVYNQSRELRIHLITMGKPDFNKLAPLLEKSYYSDNPF